LDYKFYDKLIKLRKYQAVGFLHTFSILCFVESIAAGNALIDSHSATISLRYFIP